MRIRITLAAAMLALSFATITAARQGAEGARPQAPADSKAALRPKVARLRAEVELMQLEHEGDVAVMKDLIKGLKFSEAVRAAGDQAPQASVKMVPKIYEESKKGFLDRSAALNEKQMELLDLEQRMSMIP
jgi:hypothetical protein